MSRGCFFLRSTLILHTSYFILHTSLQCEIIPRISFELVILFSSQLRLGRSEHSTIRTFEHSIISLFAGGHRGVVIPVPIPNTAVKGPIAEGSAGVARARVGRRRLFYFSIRAHGARPRGTRTGPAPSFFRLDYSCPFCDNGCH